MTRRSKSATRNCAKPTGLHYTTDLADLATANVYIVTVPTPIDEHKRPDLSPLIKASGDHRRGPEEGRRRRLRIRRSIPAPPKKTACRCSEAVSGLKFNVDFYAGYSPERINPGDKLHRVSTIKKVTSGSTPEVAELVDQLYSEIIVAGTHKASSIKVAEAAKVIENTQRDLNIALINELAIIFNRMGIDTEAVLQAAGTKWNFLPFRPGLVGGHCIGVDPYYLTHKARRSAITREIILAGRRLNDGMGAYVTSQLVKALIKRRIHVEGARILVMGLTFKENCPDLRNTRVVDIVRELADYNVSRRRLRSLGQRRGGPARIWHYSRRGAASRRAYDAIILAVAHDQFRDHGGRDDQRLRQRRARALRSQICSRPRDSPICVSEASRSMSPL